MLTNKRTSERKNSNQNENSSNNGKNQLFNNNQKNNDNGLFGSQAPITNQGPPSGLFSSKPPGSSTLSENLKATKPFFENKQQSSLFDNKQQTNLFDNKQQTSLFDNKQQTSLFQNKENLENKPAQPVSQTSTAVGPSGSSFSNNFTNNTSNVASTSTKNTNSLFGSSLQKANENQAPGPSSLFGQKAGEPEKSNNANSTAPPAVFFNINVSQNVLEAITKQKPIQSFLAELDEKYEQNNFKSTLTYDNYFNDDYLSHTDNYLGYKTLSAPRLYKTEIKGLKRARSIENNIRDSLLSSYGIRNTKKKMSIENLTNLTKGNLFARRKINENRWSSDFYSETGKEYNLESTPKKNWIEEQIELSNKEGKKEQSNKGSRNKYFSYPQELKTAMFQEDPDEIEIIVRLEKEEEEHVLENISLDIKVSELKEKIFEKLFVERELGVLNFEPDDLNLLLLGQIMNDNKSLAEYLPEIANKTIICLHPHQFASNNLRRKNSFEILYDEYNESQEKRKTSFELLSDSIENESKIAPDHLIPVLTKPGYKTFPSIVHLCRMSIEELKNIENFKIYNQFGEVEYLETVNLLGLNLDKLFDIRYFYIDIKDDDLPEINVKKRCTMNEIFPQDKNENKEEFLDGLKLKIKEMKGKFISYNKITGSLVFEY